MYWMYWIYWIYLISSYLSAMYLSRMLSFLIKPIQVSQLTPFIQSVLHSENHLDLARRFKLGCLHLISLERFISPSPENKSFANVPLISSLIFWCTLKVSWLAIPGKAALVIAGVLCVISFWVDRLCLAINQCAPQFS